MKKPSVTQLLDLMAKPALISWANKLGLQGIDIKEKRKKSLAKGSSMHAQIERTCKGEQGFEREIDAMSFANFLQDKQVISMEQDIETEWFVGRYDAAIIHDDEYYIVDYKSGFKNRIYLEYKLQLVAYTMAIPASMAIVPIPQFHLVPVEIINREPYEQMLIQLSKLWHLKKEIENV